MSGGERGTKRKRDDDLNSNNNNNSQQDNSIYSSNITTITTPSGLSYGERILSKSGYKPGQGLGARAQGRVDPVIPEERISREGVGFQSQFKTSVHEYVEQPVKLDVRIRWMAEDTRAVPQSHALVLDRVMLVFSLFFLCFFFVFFLFLIPVFLFALCSWVDELRYAILYCVVYAMCVHSYIHKRVYRYTHVCWCVCLV